MRVTVHVDAQMLVLRVADHGPGLPAAIREMMTEIPAELRPRVTEDNGSGLGLAIAQRMTLALGGRIAALDSREGAVLEVCLPLVHGQDAEPSAPSQHHPDKLEMACLVVDDDPINAQVTVAMLERLGLSVDYAESIAQAHALCQAEAGAYDVFVVDFRLPDGTRVDFARQLRQGPGAARRPHLPAQRERGMGQAGPADARLFVALLKKPLDAASLAQAIHEGCDRRRPRICSRACPPVQRRMAETFAANWCDFRPALAAAGPRLATTTSPGVPTNWPAARRSSA